MSGTIITSSIVMQSFIFDSLFLFIQLTNMKKNFLLSLAVCIALQLSAQKTFIWCGILIDGVSDEPKKNMTIVVEKNKIVAVENGFSTTGTNDNVIDLKTKTVTPGWIDCHVHLSHETNPNA